MKHRLLFIINPHSGKGLIKNHLLGIIDCMVKAGFEVTAYITQAQGDAISKVQEDGADYDRIVCCGGDGTLDEVATGMIRAGLKLPLGYIPAGSTNDFANSLKLPKRMPDAAQVAVDGREFSCDMGSFNGDSFVYVAAFGLFTAVSYQTPQELKNVLGHIAYILEGAKSLRDVPSIHMAVEVNGESFEDDFLYGMVTNSVSVGGFKGMTGSDVQLDDGLFEGTFIKNPKNPIELNEILTALGKREDDSDMIYSFKSDDIHIISEKTTWTLDGEYGGEYEEVHIRVLKQRIPLLIEKGTPGSKMTQMAGRTTI